MNSNEQFKQTNLIYLLIGFVLPMFLIIYVSAEQPTIKELAEQAIDGAVATTESGTTMSGETVDKGVKLSTEGIKKDGPSNNQNTQGGTEKTVSGTSKEIAIKGFPEDSIANLVANKAYKERGLDLVLTLIGENGSFQLDRQSDCVSNGIRERSFGLCQLSYKYHKPFIDSPDFKDREKQTAYCIEVRDDAKRKGTMPFNAYWVRNNYKNRIIYK